MMKSKKAQYIVLLVLLLGISPILFAATEARKDSRPSSADPYIIKNGDTLWDISEVYLKNPFLWPEIWKENRYILDPNLIFPGNRLNIPGIIKAEDMTRIEGVKDGPPSVLAPNEKGGEQVVGDDIGGERMPPQSEESEMILEEERVFPDKTNELKTTDIGAGDKGSIMQMVPEIFKKGDDLLSIDYIIADGIDGGVILGSRDNRELLAEMDRVYIKAPKGEIPIVGDSYTVVRKVKKVMHPKTGKPIGNLIRTLGIIKVVEVNNDLVAADIIRSMDYITKGDRIIPRGQTPEVSAIMVQEKIKLKGYIVETNYDKKANAQFDIVYIDLGRKEGVLPGDNFLIYEEGKKVVGYSQAEEGLSSDIAIGRLKILLSQEDTSTALVVKSSDVIEKGFIVEKVVE